MILAILEVNLNGVDKAGIDDMEKWNLKHEKLQFRKRKTDESTKTNKFRCFDSNRI
jgi:hypothetical protein